MKCRMLLVISILMLIILSASIVSANENITEHLQQPENDNIEIPVVTDKIDDSKDLSEIKNTNSEDKLSEMSTKYFETKIVKMPYYTNVQDYKELIFEARLYDDGKEVYISDYIHQNENDPYHSQWGGVRYIITDLKSEKDVINEVIYIDSEVPNPTYLSLPSLKINASQLGIGNYKAYAYYFGGRYSNQMYYESHSNNEIEFTIYKPVSIEFNSINNGSQFSIKLKDTFTDNSIPNAKLRCVVRELDGYHENFYLFDDYVYTDENGEYIHTLNNIYGNHNYTVILSPVNEFYSNSTEKKQSFSFSTNNEYNVPYAQANITFEIYEVYPDLDYLNNILSYHFYFKIKFPEDITGNFHWSDDTQNKTMYLNSYDLNNVIFVKYNYLGGDYIIKYTYEGDDKYSSTSGVSILNIPINKSNSNTNSIINKNENTQNNNKKSIVKKSQAKISAKNIKFKFKKKTKKYSIYLKGKRKGITKTKIFLKVNGKIYTAKTNDKGKATFKITKLKKKGTYKATITFKGNKNYNKVIKTVKIRCI